MNVHSDSVSSAEIQGSSWLGRCSAQVHQVSFQCLCTWKERLTTSGKGTRKSKGNQKGTLYQN